MIDRDFWTAEQASLNRDFGSGSRRITVGQRYESGIPSNSPQRTITFTNVPQWPILAIGGYDAPEGMWDIAQNTGYGWTPQAISGSTGTGAGSSTFWFGRRELSKPALTYNAQGGAGGGTGYEECCAVEMPGLLGEVLWQGMTAGTATVLTTPQPKQGYWVPGCIFLVVGRWRSGGASSFAYAMSNGQTPFLILMGNITGAALYRYLPGSRPTCAVTFPRSVLGGVQAAIIR